MKPKVLIRPSAPADIAAITEIYRHHVLHGTGTFEIEPPDQQEIARRRDKVLERSLPWLVAEADGLVAGYAYAGPFKMREAYRFTVEDSVYVRKESLGQGIGKALLEELVASCRRVGCKQILAVIGDTANIASIRVHESCSFHHVGMLKNVGFKFDRWVDVVLMQRDLGEDSL